MAPFGFGRTNRPYISGELKGPVARRAGGKWKAASYFQTHGRGPTKCGFPAKKKTNLKLRLIGQGYLNVTPAADGAHYFSGFLPRLRRQSLKPRLGPPASLRRRWDRLSWRSPPFCAGARARRHPCHSGRVGNRIYTSPEIVLAAWRYGNPAALGSKEKKRPRIPLFCRKDGQTAQYSVRRSEKRESQREDGLRAGLRRNTSPWFIAFRARLMPEQPRIALSGVIV